MLNYTKVETAETGELTKTQILNLDADFAGSEAQIRMAHGTEAELLSNMTLGEVYRATTAMENPVTDMMVRAIMHAGDNLNKAFSALSKAFALYETKGGCPMRLFKGLDGTMWAYEQYMLDSKCRRLVDSIDCTMDAGRMWELLRNHEDSPWEMASDTMWGVIAKRRK